MFKDASFKNPLNKYEILGSKLEGKYNYRIRDGKLTEAEMNRIKTIKRDVSASRFQFNPSILKSSKLLNKYLYEVLIRLKCEYIQGMHEILTVFIHIYHKIYYPNDLKKFTKKKKLRNKIINIYSAICVIYILPFFSEDPKILVTKMDIPLAKMKYMFIEYHFGGFYNYDDAKKEKKINRYMILNSLNRILTLYCFSFNSIYEYLIIFKIILEYENPEILCLIFFLYYDGEEEDKKSLKYVIENGILVRVLKMCMEHKLTLHDLNNLLCKCKIKEHETDGKKSQESHNREGEDSQKTKTGSSSYIYSKGKI